MNHRPMMPHVLAAAAIFICACSHEYSVELVDGELHRLDTLQSGGLDRVFEVQLPSDYATGSSPVVILFHRSGSDGVDMRYLTSFDIEASYYRFLAVYPYATSDWAHGCGCTSAEANGVDDVQFVADLLDVLDADYGINRDSVFAVGFEQGALMAQKVVCDAAESIAGLATVGATMSVPLAEVCAPSRAIPVVMILGTEDTVFPWDGAPDLGAESLLGADSTVQFWGAHNGCGERAASYYLGTDYYYGFDLYRESFETCPENGDVVLYRMERAGHGWPNGEFNASEEIANFFVRGCCGGGAPAYLTRD